MLEIAICDDNVRIINKIEDLLIEYFGETKVHIDNYFKGQEIVDAVKAGKDYDIIFMDIEMEYKNAGIQAGKELKELRCGHALIIFVTAHHEMVTEVFYAQPFQFLKKPINEEQFYRIMQDAVRELSKRMDLFTYSVGASFSRCAYRDIMYFSCRGRKIEIYGYRDKKKFVIGTFNSTLEKVRKDLEEHNINNFVKIHRSYIINIDYVKEFNPDRIIFINGEEMLLTKTFKKSTIERFMQYLRSSV